MCSSLLPSKIKCRIAVDIQPGGTCDLSDVLVVVGTCAIVSFVLLVVVVALALAHIVVALAFALAIVALALVVLDLVLAMCVQIAALRLHVAHRC